MGRAYEVARRKPYTEVGLARLKCFRVGCGNRAESQWQICADGNVYRPLCASCDVELNELVLRWTGIPDAEEKLERYRQERL